MAIFRVMPALATSDTNPTWIAYVNRSKNVTDDVIKVSIIAVVRTIDKNVGTRRRTLSRQRARSELITTTLTTIIIIIIMPSIIHTHVVHKQLLQRHVTVLIARRRAYSSEAIRRILSSRRRWHLTLAARQPTETRLCAVVSRPTITTPARGALTRSGELMTSPTPDDAHRMGTTTEGKYCKHSARAISTWRAGGHEPVFLTKTSESVVFVLTYVLFLACACTYFARVFSVS